MVWLYKINWLSMHLSIESEHETHRDAFEAKVIAGQTLPDAERMTTTYGVVEPTPEMITTQQVLLRQDGRIPAPAPKIET